MFILLLYYSVHPVDILYAMVINFSIILMLLIYSRGRGGMLLTYLFLQGRSHCMRGGIVRTENVQAEPFHCKNNTYQGRQKASKGHGFPEFFSLCVSQILEHE